MTTWPIANHIFSLVRFACMLFFSFGFYLFIFFALCCLFFPISLYSSSCCIWTFSQHNIDQCRLGRFVNIIWFADKLMSSNIPRKWPHSCAVLNIAKGNGTFCVYKHKISTYNNSKGEKADFPLTWFRLPKPGSFLFLVILYLLFKTVDSLSTKV